jgi:hypothetical protein
MAKEFLVTPESKEEYLNGTGPVPSVSLVPDWYKKIPVDNTNMIGKGGLPISNNIKQCTPFLDAMMAGYTYILNDDISVFWEDGIPNLHWKTKKTLITEHAIDQSKGVPVPEGYYPQVLKFHNEWGIELPPGYSLWCSHPANRYDLPFLSLTGFVDADKYNLSIQFPFYIKNGWTGIIEAGTPLAQLIPVKREDWKIKNEDLDEVETDKRYQLFRKKIVKSYKTRYWSKKSYR